MDTQPRVPCIVDPESFFYMNGDGTLHAHVHDNLTGIIRCVLDNRCAVCWRVDCVCSLAIQRCPSCGSPDLREVEPDDGDLDRLELRCVDCTWQQAIGMTITPRSLAVDDAQAMFTAIDEARAMRDDDDGGAS